MLHIKLINLLQAERNVRCKPTNDVIFVKQMSYGRLNLGSNYIKLNAMVFQRVFL
jgi:hypothetical protein